MFEVLDVGCGFNPQGDVNIDLHTGISEHRASRPLIPQEIPNFVLCDAQHLPFKDDAFPKVFSKDTLEHVGGKPQENNSGPYRMLREMVRVSQCIVEVEVPHRFSLANVEKRFWKREHNAFFNLRWFERVLPKIEKQLSVKLSVLVELKYKPLFIYFLMMPDKIHLMLRKRLH